LNNKRLSRYYPVVLPPALINRRGRYRLKPATGCNVALHIKFIIFQLLIIIPFVIGMRARRSLADPAAMSKKVIRLNLTMLEPPVILWSIWGLPLHSDHLYLPLAGLVIVVAGFIMGVITLPLLKLEGTSRKTYLISASLANHGFTMGGFICYLFLKETGLGLSSIFIIYFMPYTFIAIFSYARMKGGRLTMGSLRDFLIGYQNMPLYAALLALMLHMARVQRPQLEPPVDILIMISMALYYWALGLSFSPAGVLPLKAEHFTLAAIKFLALPALTFLALLAVPLDPDVKSVIRIQSFMPAAIYSVVTSVLFDLDTRLASSLFVVNSIVFMLVVLPLIFFLHGAGFF
jgi:predicted permease